MFQPTHTDISSTCPGWPQFLLVFGMRFAVKKADLPEWALELRLRSTKSAAACASADRVRFCF